MGWEIDKRSARFGYLSSAAQASWDEFQNNVFRGEHPKIAAQKAGDTHYKCLSARLDQYQIRLSGGDRATFTVDDTARLVTVLQVGGHS